MKKSYRLLLAACLCMLALTGGNLSALSAAAPALAWLETQYSLPGRPAGCPCAVVCL